MFNSARSAFGKSSDSWDTDYARKFLKIPDDQLKVLDSFPVEKLTTGTKTNKKHGTEEIGNHQSAEASLPKQHGTSVNTGTSVNFVETSIQNTNLKNVLFNNSETGREEIRTAEVTEKHQFLESLSLSRSKTVAVSSLLPKSTSSRFVSGVSGVEDITFKMTEVNTFPKSAEKHQLLNTTYVIPTVLDDMSNNTQNIFNNPAKKQIFEKLGSHISNQHGLSSPSKPKFGCLPVFPANPSQKPENFLSKKLKLLEKRFSPSKEFSLITPTEENSKKCNLKSTSMQMTPSVSEKSLNSISQVNVGSDNLFNVNSKARMSSNDSIGTSQSDSHSEAPQKEVPLAVKSDDRSAFQSNTYSTVPGKVDNVFSRETQPSQKEYAEKIMLKSNTSVFEEENFISQPFPCGQPTNTQSSAKSIGPDTQLPIESQVVESMSKKNADKVDVPLDVFYEKSSGQNETVDSAPAKVAKTGEKRKRKSKTDKASKKMSETRFTSFIQYSAKQIEDMIEVMRKFQNET